MKAFPWFKRMNMALTVYHNYIKKINEIISSAPGRKSKEIFKLQTLLWDMELELNIADQKFYEQNLFASPQCKNLKARTEKIDTTILVAEYHLN